MDERLDPQQVAKTSWSGDLLHGWCRIGLDQGRFDSCLDSGQYSEQVQRDLKEGVRAGVTGTPALFVNGVPIEWGAVPYETFVLAIEKEKARLQK